MLIPSKLSRPVRLEHTVVRERLLAKLSGANNYRLALVTSPAGYGKTTLVSQWAAGKNDLGWFSLDEGDNQQERFASYLIAAVQQATGGHCAASEAMVQKRQEMGKRRTEGAKAPVRQPALSLCATVY